MKYAISIIAVTSLLLAGCSHNDGAGLETPTSSASTSSQTSSSSSTSSSSTNTPVPAVEQATEENTVPSPEQQVQPPALAPVAEPTVVECLEGTPGPALWSDGTKRYSQWCFDSRGGAQVLENESNAGLVPPAPQQPDPWVQGQIDWANCLEAGNTEEDCRQQLN